MTTGLRKVASIIKTDDLRDVVYRGLLDLFTEREGKAFDWLARVAERFIIICSLGLENTSGEALRQSLTSQRIILDSDIILDFLCKAERDHRTSSDLLRGWLKVGGHILVSPIVLEEVAHHAWHSA
ncbi:hypothetical protein [Tunturiibacter gelidiferens]|uniref:hypothetical protein n=1 Tax=Tunturiibacter gelidiferens TaxID=3069689 RepID=UPI003D9ABC5B